jgi:hypothetical protein
MLSVGNTLGSSSGSLSLDTRVAIGAGVFAVSAAEVSAPEPETRVISTPDQKIPAYNAIEFSYRSDFGKIILLQQNVETGQEVTQVPTEYHLRQYAATQREQRVQLQQKLYRSAAAVEQTAPQPAVVVTTTAKPTGATSAPSTGAVSTSAVSTSAPTASPPAAPSVAPSAVAAATVAHVDIKA